MYIYVFICLCVNIYIYIYNDGVTLKYKLPIKLNVL